MEEGMRVDSSLSPNSPPILFQNRLHIISLLIPLLSLIFPDLPSTNSPTYFFLFRIFPILSTSPSFHLFHSPSPCLPFHIAHSVFQFLYLIILCPLGAVDVMIASHSQMDLSASIKGGIAGRIHCS